MLAEDHWITTRITRARTDLPSVTEAVSSQMAELLRGQLSEQQLSHVELANVAKALIASMVPAPPKKDADR